MRQLSKAARLRTAALDAQEDKFDQAVARLRTLVAEKPDRIDAALTLADLRLTNRAGRYSFVGPVQPGPWVGGAAARVLGVDGFDLRARNVIKTFPYPMISGEAVLVEDDGRHAMRAGDIAVWPKGSTNGHHLVNESDADCVFVALGGGKAWFEVWQAYAPHGPYQCLTGDQPVEHRSNKRLVIQVIQS